MNVIIISKTLIVNMTVDTLYGTCVVTCNWWSRINPRELESFCKPQPYIWGVNYGAWRSHPFRMCFRRHILSGMKRRVRKRMDKKQSRQYSWPLNLSHLWWNSWGMTTWSIPILLSYFLNMNILTGWRNQAWMCYEWTKNYINGGGSRIWKYSIICSFKI